MDGHFFTKRYDIILIINKPEKYFTILEHVKSCRNYESSSTRAAKGNTE